MSHYAERDLRMKLVRTITVTSKAYALIQLPISEVITDNFNVAKTCNNRQLKCIILTHSSSL